MTPPRVADHAEREKVIHERDRNVLVDAGAGTGKTTLLVQRLLHLVAPEDDGRAFPLDRIAAITFTRRAAGELKFRVREALLQKSEQDDVTPVRRERLVSALSMLDNARISTIHSFADRLLRLRPADARVSPSYEIAEDTDELIDETSRSLLDAANRAGTAGGLDDEGAETIQAFQAAGLLIETEELEWTARLGFNAFVRDVIETRDRHVEMPSTAVYERAQVSRCADELATLVRGLSSASVGSKTLHRLSQSALDISSLSTFRDALRRAVSWQRDVKKAAELKQAEHFADDTEAWAVRKWLCDGERGRGKNKEQRPDGPLGSALVAPLMACMATRLVRLRPAILERYAELKRSRGMLDQVDLLIELRDLLAGNRDARRFFQGLFDHVMVDEFQDTDPVQAEIVLYLCETDAQAAKASDVCLRPGALTIVGDPKQSIYRFRRADIAIYAAVCDKLRASDCCEAQLRVNFRSAPNILKWLNDGFDAVLGAEEKGLAYDAETGSVRNARLEAAIRTRSAPGVHVVAFGDEALNADDSRNLEGEALARYLRFVVEDSELQIRDPRTGEARSAHYGDVAVIMIATQTVHHLLAELDLVGIPHVVRGGTLFMQDPLHQQFVLGLRALSDPGDGVARCALLRPPFFAVGLDDLVRSRAGQPKTPALEQAEALIAELRRTRHHSPVGESARRILEGTGFGRYVASSVNGAQRLARLYELCLRLDELSRATGMDFDSVTETARSSIDAPVRIEAPLPIDADAVQVITAHQAKGLEWPIVAFWDGRARWQTYLPQVAFTVDPVNGQWALKLHGLAYDPTERALHDREHALRKEERKRVAYVAMTRARDLLIIPQAGEPKDKTITGQLLLNTTERDCSRPKHYGRDGDGWWQSARGVSMRPIPPLHQELNSRWLAAAKHALQSDLAPLAVATAAHALPMDADTAARSRPRKPGRFGAEFGTAVHRALQLVLDQSLALEAAAQRAAQTLGIEDKHALVLADVTRAHVALRDAGLLNQVLRVEYPIAGAFDRSDLLVGNIDLLVFSADSLTVVDFKTDAPPQSALVDSHPEYVNQVSTYVRLLEGSGVAGNRTVKAGLLFTADGSLRWVST